MRQKQRMRVSFSLALMTLFALMLPLLAACGGAAPQATTGTTSATAGATTAATAAGTRAATAGTGQATTAATAAATSPATRAAGSPAAGSAGSPAASPRTGSPAASPSAQSGGGFPSGGKYSTLEPVGKKGGHVTQIDFGDAKTLNPMLSTDTASGARIALIFNALTNTDPDTGMPYADLATEVPTLDNGGIAKDGLTYTFKLRQDVKWQDGQPFTSQDVVYTYTTMMNKDLGGPRTSDLTEQIDAVTAPDQYTVVFKLKKVVAPFLTSSMYAIVPQHLLKDVPINQIKAHPFSTGDPKVTIGTGPFKFQEWVKDDRTVLVKNPTFFRGEPALDQYIFKVVKDSTVVVAQLKTGEGDFGGISPSSFEEMSKVPHLNVSRYDTYSTTYMAYQLDPEKSKLFQDKQVRQALIYALDRDAMIKAIHFGFATTGQGTMPTLSWAYAPDQMKTKYTYDRAKAESLLDAAGWTKGPDGIRVKDGTRLSFTIYTNAGNKVREQYITVMQQQWKAIGVEATPKTEEWNAFLTRINETHDFEVYLSGFAFDTDPDQTTFWACAAYKGGFNRMKYCNPQVDDLFAKGLVEIDQNKRKQYYIEAQNILVDEAPAFMMDFPQSLVGVNKRVHNLKPNAINIRWNVHLWWVDDGK